MNKKVRDALLGVLALGVVSGLYFWSKQTTPEQAAAQLFDMNVPARYVFVGDAAAPRLVSVDMESGALAGDLPLQAVPHLMAMNKNRGLLAYADGEARQVVVRDLASHAEQVFALPHDVAGMAFDSDSAHLFLYGKTALSLLDVQSGSLQTLDGFAEIRSLHFEPFAREIVLLDGGARAVKRVQLPGQEVVAAALPETWQDFTASALSPGGEFLLFGVFDAAQGRHLGVVWRSADQGWETYPMSAPLLQPFTDNNAEALFFMDESGQGLRVDARNPGKVQSFASVDKPSRFALGWLDKHLLVAGESEVRLHDSATLETLAQTPFPGAAQDIFITADSKSALLTGKGSQDLLVYDVRDGGEMRGIALGKMGKPAVVMMGAGYTLCH